jgi:predicted PP-loop superfamily ATPase
MFRLRFDRHQIDEVQAVASYSGGNDGTLSLQASAANHRFMRNPMLSLQTVTLRADGEVWSAVVDRPSANVVRVIPIVDITAKLVSSALSHG